MLPVAVTTGVPAFGVTVSARVEAMPLPHRLFPHTEILPEEALAAKFTRILKVPAPLAIVAPAWSVHT